MNNDKEHELIDIRGEARKRMATPKERDMPESNLAQRIQPDIQPEWIFKAPEKQEWPRGVIQERPRWLIPALIFGAVLVLVVIVLGVIVVLRKPPTEKKAPEKPVPAKTTKTKRR